MKLSFFCSLLFLSLVTSAFAETVTTVSLPLSGPQDQSLPLAYVELLDGDGDIVSGATASESTGEVFFYSIEEGAYQIATRMAISSDCSECAVLIDVERDVIISKDSSRYDDSTDTFTLEAIQLEAATRIVTVSVVDAANEQGVEGIYVSAFENTFDDEPLYRSGITNDDGEFSFGVPDSVTSSFGVSSYDANSPKQYGDTFAPNVAIGASTTSVRLEVDALNSTVRFTLKNSADEAITLEDGEFVSFSCFVPGEFDQNYYGFVNGPGEATGDIRLFAEEGGTEFTCSVYLEDSANAPVTFTIEPDQTLERDIEVVTPDATLEIVFQDTEGNEIDMDDLGTEIDVGCWVDLFLPENEGSAIEHFPNYSSQFSDGPAVLSVLSGVTYSCWYYFQESFESFSVRGGKAGTSVRSLVSSQSGTDYISDFSIVNASATSGATAPLPFTLRVANATLRVSLLDFQGQDTPGWISVTEQVEFTPGEEEQDDFGFFTGKQSFGAPGGVEIPVEGGKTYFVDGFPEDAQFGGNGSTLIPAGVEVFVASNGSEEVVLQALQADATVNITVNTTISADGDDDLGSGGFCYAHGAGSTYIELSQRDSSTYEGSLSLASGREYFIGCQVVDGENFFSGSEVELQVAEGEQDLSIELSTAGAYINQYVCFDATAQSTIPIGDNEENGSQLIVPANAIANSGTVCVEIKTAEKYSPGQHTPSNVLEIKAFKSDGTTVTDFSNSPLNLKLCPDETVPGQVGDQNEDDEGSVYGLSEDPNQENGSWVPSSETDADGCEQFTVTHLSFYGLFGNRSSQNGSCSVVGRPKVQLRGKKAIVRGKITGDASQVVVRFDETRKNRSVKTSRKSVRIKTNKKGKKSYRTTFRAGKKARRLRAYAKAEGCSDTSFISSRVKKVKKKKRQ
ncbi:hypothetical protein MRY87_11490 [bacterium]|nr:hypothetical protein [bacterium]